MPRGRPPTGKRPPRHGYVSGDGIGREPTEFYRALKVLNQETLHVKLPDEYHGTRAVFHRLT
jgi:hypothetical protein